VNLIAQAHKKMERSCMMCAEVGGKKGSTFEVVRRKERKGSRGRDQSCWCERERHRKRKGRRCSTLREKKGGEIGLGKNRESE
jgi:hypothetical protein